MKTLAVIGWPTDFTRVLGRSPSAPVKRLPTRLWLSAPRNSTGELKSSTSGLVACSEAIASTADDSAPVVS